MLREFDTGSKHLPFGNCSINSHDLFSLSCIARRKLMLITLVTRASDKSQKKKSNFAAFFVIKFADKLANFVGILQEFLRQTSPKSNRQTTADFVVIFRANFAGNRLDLR